MAYREKLPDGTVRIVNPRLEEAWPVGAVYMSMLATDPGTLFGGTWARMAQGRMLVGVDEGDASFDAPGDTGGSKTHIISTPELPPHQHAIDHNHGAVNTTGGAHTHEITRRAGVGSDTGMAMGNSTAAGNATTFADSPNHTHTVDMPAYTGMSGVEGSGNPISLLSPYLAVYIWRRTA